jgi:hypothetical protein
VFAPDVLLEGFMLSVFELRNSKGHIHKFLPVTQALRLQLSTAQHCIVSSNMLKIGTSPKW